jgi:hypothetical protein
MAGYYDTPQSKVRRNREYKLCLNGSADWSVLIITTIFELVSMNKPYTSRLYRV